MPFALIIAGIVLTVAGVRDTQSALFSLLKGDFTGQGNYTWWAVSVLAIGATGYVEAFKQLSHYFLALILLVLILAKYKNGQSVFDEFVAALKGPIPPAPVPNKSGGGGILGTIESGIANGVGMVVNPGGTAAQSALDLGTKLSHMFGG